MKYTFIFTISGGPQQEYSVEAAEVKKAIDAFYDANPAPKGSIRIIRFETGS